MDDLGLTVRTHERMDLCNSTGDIISDLPSNILDKILVCLPIQDAARTSILSKHWRFKWLYIPQLVFNSEDFFRIGVSRSKMQVWFNIYQILALHRGDLSKFVLSIQEKMDIETCPINQIILILHGKNIQDLTLSLPSVVPCYELVSTLFHCLQLRHLNLSACVIKLPREFIGFSRLISVEFRRVKIDSDDFITFLSQCPLLQRLTLEDVYGGSPFKIDAPNLKFLYFDCGFMYILLGNVPVLSTLIIKDCARLLNPTTTNVVTVFRSLPAMENFSARINFVWTLSVDVTPASPPIMLNHLKTLELEVSFGCLNEVKCLLLLMESSPNLQNLKIKVNDLDDDDDDDDDNISIIQLFNEDEDEDDNDDNIPNIQLFKNQSLIGDSFNQLQEVTLKDFYFIAHELEFLQFVLAKSPVLKNVILLYDCEAKPSFEIGRGILKKVTRLQRASPEAEIIYL